MQLYSLPHEYKSEANGNRKEGRRGEKEDLMDELKLFSTQVQPEQALAFR